MRSLPRRAAMTAALAVCSAALLALPACGSSKSSRPLRPQGEVTAAPRDLPSILRGTIGAETTVRGGEPQLITGYGIVVGLNGTGSRDAPAGLRAQLEREAGLKGIGKESIGFGGLTPAQLIESPNTAVVLVQARVSPGAPNQSKFDVLVTTLPGSAATSLEGGTLWSTDLYEGLVVPGGPATQPIAVARGPIFINPFADPAGSAELSINQTSGRILSGGTVTQPQELLLVLDSPSHARARAVANAINDAFPQGPRDRLPIAQGRDGESIQVIIPTAYADRPQEFMELMAHTRVDRTFPESWAARYIRTLRDEPGLASDMSWCLQALGPVALPFLREMYDYAEPLPRLSALRAGARLGDALATPHLQDLARNGEPQVRLRAIELLGDMPTDPKVNLALRELVDDKSVAVRIAAYEALSKRADPWLRSRMVYGTPHQRKFRLDMVRSNDPMIYVSQQGEPRIAVFGNDLQILPDSMVFAWADRLMLVSDSEKNHVRVRYQDWRPRKSPFEGQASHDVGRLIEFMAHEPTPEDPAPGLGLSYSEVVGALYELTEKSGAIAALFVAEQDRLRAELIAAVETDLSEARPELFGEELATEEEEGLDPGLSDLLPGQGPRPGATPEEPQKPTYVVPLQQTTPTKGRDER